MDLEEILKLDGPWLLALSHWECPPLPADSRHIVATIPGGGLASREDLLRAVSCSLSFPDYFGHNWDATIDMLQDLEWMGKADDLIGIIILITGCGHLKQVMADDLDVFLGILRETAELWRSGGVGFTVILLP